MSTINNGGPAFPQHDLSGYGFGPWTNEDGSYSVGGMSLRAYLASQALPTVIAVLAADLRRDEEDKPRTLGRAFAANVAYHAAEIADALIAELGSGNGTS